MQVNAGHDLNLQNLTDLVRAMELAEVSIGHTLITEALQFGFERVIRHYLELLSSADGA